MSQSDPAPQRAEHTAAPMPAATVHREALTANTVAAILGLAAFAVSFTHVVRLAVRSGQTGWVAVGIATSVELMALAAVTEIRRRSRRGEPTAWPRCVLVLGVVMSLAANLATAQPTAWGYVMAAWPAVAFLSVAAMIETRTLAAPGRTHSPYAPAPVPGVREQPAEIAPDPSDQRVADAARREQPRPGRKAVVAALLDAMRADPDWKPDYPALITATGYSRSWCEKRVAQARAHHAADTRTSPHAPPDGTRPPRTPAAPRPADPPPVPLLAQGTRT